MSEKDISSFENQQWGKLTNQAAVNSRSEDMIDINNVIDYLKNNVQFREFGETIQLWMDKKRVNQECLIEYFLQSANNRETIRKNISNWLASRNIPDRRSLIQLCFALKLTTSEAKELLTRFSDEGWLHIRNPEEIVYYYCFNTGLDFYYAQRFISEKANRNYITTENEHSKIKYSFYLERELDKINSEIELVSFLNEHQSDFLCYRYTAYKRFESIINELIQESRFINNQINDDELKKEIRKINEIEYNQLFKSDLSMPVDIESLSAFSKKTRMKVPFSRKTDGYSDVQRSLKKLWPNRQTIIDMLDKKVCITRKALLLAYILIDEDEDFDDYYHNINDMLDMCGFHLLDPRAPFDWIIINSYNSIEKDDSIESKFLDEWIQPEKRMSQIIDMLFNEQNNIQSIEESNNSGRP